MTTPELLLALIAIFAGAKIFGELAERIGQPAVLGEMVAGVVIGISGLGLVDPKEPTIHLLSELGVLLLLFLIGLETDFRRLLAFASASTSVAVVGVILPFAGGYAMARLLGISVEVAVFLGACLTATSVGITARVLSDLGHLRRDESQVILGAAVLDDILGLVLLSVLTSIAAGQSLTAGGVARDFGVAFGFVAAALVIGSLLAPRLIALISHLRVTKALFFASTLFAFVLAYLADLVGSAMLIGAFAAGLVLARTDRGRDIEREVHDVAQFFIPLFFVSVGAAINLQTLNPLNPETRQFFVIGLLLTVVGTVTKLAAGFAAFGRPLRKLVIGVGMIPRGEVGLVFAQIGLAAGILSTGLFSSVTMMVMITTFVAPPLLRALLPGTRGPGIADDGAVSSLVNDSLSDFDEKELPD